MAKGRRNERRWSDEEVQSFRARYRAGENIKAMAREIGARECSIRSAIRGRTYADVPGWVTNAEMRHPRCQVYGGRWTNEAKETAK